MCAEDTAKRPPEPTGKEGARARNLCMNRRGGAGASEETRAASWILQGREKTTRREATK